MSAIILLSDTHQYYLYAGRTDLRKSFDGLCGVVRNELGREVCDKEVFIFLNKRCTHIKLLLHELSGFTLLYRRLDQGRFLLPTTAPVNGSVRMTATDLLSMLHGLHLHVLK